MTLYNVPADASYAITPGGAAVTTTVTIPGQKAVATFNATASQRVSLSISTVTTTTCTDISIRRPAPDETVLVSYYCFTNDGFLDAVTLPTAGAYRVVVNPGGAGTGSVTLTLHDVPADVTDRSR